ncbi:MAG TPA: NADH-quinone oxidoreductase subunit NuoG [Steroidobacteraceae bacterium]|jgi:NADH-quinone oxidoreductase subunit G|nr:NADH-quinone oxidoreductase subunit NuoG [Steroidobacteraceae bacterium]
MSDDLVNIEVNGIPLKARKGEMIMQVTDAADVYIPRFCYHAKLTVAANCRMCLVEVEKAPKPLPACATPVMEGMKVFTRSPKAVAAQRATMEFLLINHPLDCPICDQGGECELQDLAMGYGRDISRFSERKRVVKDKNIGPLVSTDMTRCIQCTRCVRFGLEIQGYPQLGTTGRGEHMMIDTYIEQSLDHELSANIIDLCPVGALNNKPFRYNARAWEMAQHALVSPHDGLGTNIYAHSLRGRLMRVVPRENEELNETWIADRDRFGFEGMYSPDRAAQPMVRVEGVLRPVDWEVALTAAAEGLQKVSADRGASNLGFLTSPSATVEEMYLLAKLARGLGSSNIDHRLRQLDFRGQDQEGVFPNLGVAIADVDVLEGALVVGSNLRHEMPLLAHRIRKAALKGAKVAFLNPREYDYLFPVAGYIADPDLVGGLAAVVRAAAGAAGQPVPAGTPEAEVRDAHRTVAAALGQGPRRAIFVGTLAQRHPAYAEIRSLAAALAQLSGASLGLLTEGANAAGAYLAGAVPHREPGGSPTAAAGLTARSMLEQRLKAYVLFGGIDPINDLAFGADALAGADLVIAATTHLTEKLREIAHVVLPIGCFAESAGTFVNVEGRWQSWTGAAGPVGESRPGWKVLRVLANLLNLHGVDFVSSEEVRESLKSLCGPRLVPVANAVGTAATARAGAAAAWVDIPPYQIDVLVRGSESLAKTKDGHAARTVL